MAGCARPGGWWDPRADLEELAGHGIGALVTLTEEALDPAAIAERDFRYLHLPVPDFHPPTLEQLRAFVEFVDACAADGTAVAVHCAAGMGRTGTMLAGYLVSTGVRPAEAVRAVRTRRPGSIETTEQEKCLDEYYRVLTRER